VWTNCGVYTEPIDPNQTTHSLEHGAVWIGYDPALPADQVQALADAAQANNYVLVSPVDGVPAPVTVSAWGVQLKLDDAKDPRLPVFLAKYQQGEQAPEPGAPCTGGVGAS
jgi:DMSO/TMAO reductase YedYZ molybdopterin-dependent catalytic subunit